MSPGGKFTVCSRDGKIREPRADRSEGARREAGSHTLQSPVWALGESGLLSGGRTDLHSSRITLATVWRALSHEAQPRQRGRTGGCCRGSKPVSGNGVDSQVLDREET